VERKTRYWLKAHVICGVKTGIITSVVLTWGKGENPYFGPLVRATARNFDINEIYADKAYSADLSLQAAANVGAVPFIPFKKGASPKKGGLWEKFYHYYHLKKDEFAEHYHKRSNAEALFSAIKRVVGHYLRSRSHTAMENEALCKLLCLNITCLIHSKYELGITPTFWKTKSKDDVDTAA
jgi:transposase